MASVFALSLPAVNGSFIAGIAAGSDEQLPLKDRLEIPKFTLGADPDANKDILLEARAQMVLKLYRKYATTAEGAHLGLMIGAALGLFDKGLIRTHRTLPASDWVSVDMSADALVTNPEQAAISLLATDANISIALHLIAATKVNFWKENHHVGQGKLSRYVQKVFDMKYPGSTLDDAIKIRIVHRIGHWGPTRTILTQLGLNGAMQEVAIANGGAGSGLRPADDIRLRIDSNPAGTARVTLANEGFNKFRHSQAVTLCPNLGDYIPLPGIINTIKRNPIAYHVGAEYLTGNPRANHNDTDYERLLGRVGTFLYVTMEQATLFQSPHLKGDRFKGYSDYSADLEAALTAYKRNASRAQSGIVLGSGAAALEADYVAVMQAYGDNPSPRIMGIYNAIGAGAGAGVGAGAGAGGGVGAGAGAGAGAGMAP